MELLILYFDDGEWEDAIPFSNFNSVIEYLKQKSKLYDNFHVEKYHLESSGKFDKDGEHYRLSYFQMNGYL